MQLEGKRNLRAEDSERLPASRVLPDPVGYVHHGRDADASADQERIRSFRRQAEWLTYRTEHANGVARLLSSVEFLKALLDLARPSGIGH